MKAQNKGIKVVPFTGPSSLMLALMASGKNGQNFSFIGYLPVKSDDRRSKIKELEKHVARSGQSQIMIETPYRNNALLADFLQVCSDVTTLTVAAGITTGSEFIATKTIAQWKREAGTQ
jgi:16S rRNA (cytidine1402-2'-O)-methyltransferase